MRKIRNIFLAVLFLPIHCSAMVEDFFTTKDITYKNSSNGSSFTAKIDFPITGSNFAMKNVKEWICEILETDTPSAINESDIKDILLTSFTQFKEDHAQCSRTIDIYRSYEDETIVTYESEIIDKDSVIWTSTDCASFSKKDGHRLSIDEIFKCDENKIKELMWEYRGDLPMETQSAKELAVGNAAYIDGWVIVIGPAYHHSGASYRIRYSAALPYLQTSKDGKYYDPNRQ